MDAELLHLLTLLGVEPTAGALDTQLLVAGLFFLGTAALVALCVPGVLLPMALSSGALLGAWEAAAVVALGAVAGSQLFFLTARHFAADRLRGRLGQRFEAFQRRFASHGLLYVIGLRLVGTPHFVVTGASALMPIRASGFAAATLLGVLPAITIAAATGSAI